VRRNALLTLNYIAHNKPILIREVLPSYLPLVYEESKPKPELIREVDLGPFKHKVDDGLELRKAAFECMYTLLDTCLDRVDIPSFIVNLVGGLKDHYDVKMLAHLMLVRLAVVAGPALLEGLDQLVEPLRQTLGSKPKESAVKQEVERNDELIRSALRAIYSITRIPNVETNHKFEEFLKQSIKTGEFAEKFAAIKAESEQAEGVADPMDLS
jgi:cullin-associated NEDD8-dissociated protein 1